MTSPISVGDAILLAKTAYNLFKAFTSGRKSAPAEFLEIQGLLYTLSNALDLVAKQPPGTTSQQIVTHNNSDGRISGSVQSESQPEDSDTIMKHCLANCDVTLKHLQALVTKYMEIDPNATETSASRWRDDVRRNWRKVTWTREGAGLEKLKNSLTAHINGINLALAAQHKSQGELTLSRVGDLSDKLDEIYDWFVDNLKNKQPAPKSMERPSYHSTTLQEPELLFSLWSEAAQGTANPVLVCPRACFRIGWAEFLTGSSRHNRVFDCCCLHVDRASSHNDTATGVRHPRLDYFLLPISLLIRTASRGSGQEWRLYTGSPSSPRPVLLVLRGVSPSMTAAFEQHVDANHARQANTTPIFRKLVSSTFDSNGRHFKTPRIDTVQFIHYKCIRGSSIVHEEQVPKLIEPFRELSDAHLVLHCTEPPSSIPGQSWTIKVTMETKVRLSSNLSEISLSDVACTANEQYYGIRSDSEGSVQCCQVMLLFEDLESASLALDLIKLMQEELRISYLKGCRWEEQIMYSRDLGDITIQEYGLRDARLEVVLNPKTARYRLIISSTCKSTFVCTELPADFLPRMAREERLAQLDLPMWFVEITDNGTHVTKRSTMGQFPSISLLEHAGQARPIE